MTRDEQIAQLKPGDKVRVPYLASMAQAPELTFLGWHPLTKAMVEENAMLAGKRCKHGWNLRRTSCPHGCRRALMLPIDDEPGDTS